MRDISETGAKLTFAAAVTTPDIIELQIPAKDEIHRVHVQWRFANEIGVAFGVGDDEQAPGTTPPELFGRVMKLESEVASLKRALSELRSEMRKLEDRRGVIGTKTDRTFAPPPPFHVYASHAMTGAHPAARPSANPVRVCLRGDHFMAADETGTLTGTLRTLFAKGVRYATVIDLGCADGHFFLMHQAMGLFPDAVPVNIDANVAYEESLKAIQEVMGGHYLIAAAADKPGELEMTTSMNPYWGSLRPPSDGYWERLNQLHHGKTRVPAVTLDAVAETHQLKRPFLLKLDIQGAEVQALVGAKGVLRDTNVVICEADMDDFQSIHEHLVAAGFALFDVTHASYLADQTLGWFYPIYLNRRLDFIKQRAIWNAAENDKIMKAHAERRRTILDQIKRTLDEQRSRRGLG